MTLLEGFKTDSGLKLQLYRGRPASIAPPTAFIDAINETLTEFTRFTRQRVPTVEVIVLHGLFDQGDTVDQRDAFVDGFLDWIADGRWHAWGANTVMAGVSVTDIPTYVPEWLRPEHQRTYYATQISLEGLAST